MVGLSVILATFNRRPLLARVLDAYEAQRGLDTDFEVIVVDDGSTDDTLDFLSAYRARRFALRFATQANSGPGRARNAGIRLATGTIVLFTGDDVVPAADFLSAHWLAHQARGASDHAFVGRCRWPDDIEVTSTMRHVDGLGAQQFSYHYLRDGTEYDFRHFYTSNVSLRRQLLDREPSYFSTAFRRAALEDAELAYRLSRHGMRIFYLAHAVGQHYHSYDVRRFFARQVACGEMAAILCDKYPEIRGLFGLRRLEEAVLKTASESSWERRRSARIVAHLEDLEERAIRLGSFYDWRPCQALDPYLLALFDYAQLRGLADATYAPSAARSARAMLLRGGVMPAAVAFGARLTRARIPLPDSDLTAIAERTVLR